MALRRRAHLMAVRPKSFQGTAGARKASGANIRIFLVLAVTAWLGEAALSGAEPVRLVKEVQPIPDYSGAPLQRISRFADLGDRLVFVGQDFVTPIGLWATDGTTEGTVRLGSPGGGTISGPTALGHIALFGAQGGAIWKTDGTPEGTVLVKEVSLAPPEYVCGYPDEAGSPCHSFVVVGSLAFFVVTMDFSNSSQVWRTDGTSAGTLPLITFPNLPWASHLVAFGNRLYFAGSPTPESFGIFSSDGTQEGTKFFKKGVTAGGLVVAGAKLFFTDYDTNSVWVSDGSPRGTKRLTRFGPHDRSMYIADLAGAGRSAFFKVVRASGRELWTSDGTAAGTHVVIPEGQTLLEGPLSAALDGQLFFFSKVGEDYSLWVSNGTVAGTRIVKNIGPAECVNSYCDMPLEAAAGRLFFAQTDLTSDLWVSDGTEAGTHMVASFSIDSIPGGMTRLGSSVLFGAHVGPPVGPSAELWAIPAPIDVFVRDTRAKLGPCGGTAEFPVVLSGPSEEVVTVDFATADGTARAGKDYVATSGTLSFPPGSVASVVQVPLTCTPGARPARGTFFLNLSNAAEARIARSRGMANPGTGPVRTTVAARKESAARISLLP